MIDYLIVGSGLAGIAFAETALQNDKTIFVIDADLYNSSKIAAGLYNPVVLKRFTALADAKEQLESLDAFYTNLEKKLKCEFHFPLPVIRKFFSIEEQNNWFTASDKPGLSAYLSTEIIHTNYNGIDAPFGYGEVKHTGYVNTIQLLESYKTWLLENDLILKETFDHDQLQVESTSITYKNIQAHNIVFAEGFGMHQNPHFAALPLDGAKGEILIIKAPGLNLDVILNSSVFILPLGDDLFKVGATYNWTDKTEIPTAEAKNELTERLREILTCDFEIIQHDAGVRPTVKDRKPLLGKSSQHEHVYILNGLGTRGVMLAPAMAKKLFEYIEYGTPIPREFDIKRFDKKK